MGEIYLDIARRAGLLPAPDKANDHVKIMAFSHGRDYRAFDPLATIWLVLLAYGACDSDLSF